MESISAITGNEILQGNNGMLQTGLLGLKLRQERTRLGMTQETLGTELGVSGGTVGAWERGEKTPDLALWPMVMSFLGISADEMLALALNGNIPALDSYAEICRRIHNPADNHVQWAKRTAQLVIRKAEEKGVSCCHWAEVLLSAVLMYMVSEFPQEGWYAVTVLRLLREAEIPEISECDVDLLSALDLKFETLEGKDKDNCAVISYRSWQRLSGSELQTSVFCAIDAVVLLAEWERNTCGDAVMNEAVMAYQKMEETIGKNDGKKFLGSKKRFMCKKCGCIFVAGSDNYYADIDSTGARGKMVYFSECPVCGNRVFTYSCYNNAFFEEQEKKRLKVDKKEFSEIVKKEGLDKYNIKNAAFASDAANVIGCVNDNDNNNVWVVYETDERGACHVISKHGSEEEGLGSLLNILRSRKKKEEIMQKMRKQ